MDVTRCYVQTSCSFLPAVRKRRGCAAGMGRLLFAQHLARAVPVQLHRLRGEMCALSSCSCPLLLFLSTLSGNPGGHLFPYSWFSTFTHLIKEPAHELFIQKRQLPFASPPCSNLVCKVKTGSAFHKRYLPNNFK